MVEPTTGTLVVFALIVIALLLFVTELLPNDITALAVLVSLVVLRPYTGVDAADAISGFSSPATITILAMYILSDGIRRSGAVDRLGYHVERFTRYDERRLLAATIGATGLSAGAINNTPVVAVFIPMIKSLAEKSGVSPSRLLLPLSYAAMLGGTLTLIGTSTNLLASDLSDQLLNHPITMFEFTPLGLLVLATGSLYLFTLAPRLVPARIRPHTSLTQTYELQHRLTRATVTPTSPLIGTRLDQLLDTPGPDVQLLKIRRDDEIYLPTSDQTIQPGDVLTLKGEGRDVRRFARRTRLTIVSRRPMTDRDLVTLKGPRVLEAILPEGSPLDGETPATAGLGDPLDTTLLALRRGDDTITHGLRDTRLRQGDTLLLQTTDESAAFLVDNDYIIVTHEAKRARPRKPQLTRTAPVALGIMATVVAVAALGLLHISVAALGGVVAMVATGCIDPDEAYDAVSWNVIFLLAGIIPLGLAMQNTGGADLIATALIQNSATIPPIALLAAIYLVTGLLANLITPVATIVLMAPVAVQAATGIGADGFPFLLAATFAASSAFMTPIGYQTNLMVYGPGGYRFTDYLRVGAPLQLLLTGVVTLGIAALWGI